MMTSRARAKLIVQNGVNGLLIKGPNYIRKPPLTLARTDDLCKDRVAPRGRWNTFVCWVVVLLMLLMIWVPTPGSRSFIVLRTATVLWNEKRELQLVG